MIEIQNNKILLDGKELQFDNKIIEAAEYEMLEHGNKVYNSITELLRLQNMKGK